MSVKIVLVYISDALNNCIKIKFSCDFKHDFDIKLYNNFNCMIVVLLPLLLINNNITLTKFVLWLLIITFMTTCFTAVTPSCCLILSSEIAVH